MRWLAQEPRTKGVNIDPLTCNFLPCHGQDDKLASRVVADRKLLVVRIARFKGELQEEVISRMF